jgi:hypothetical protein
MMSSGQASLSSGERQSLRSGEAGSALNLEVIAGVALLALGAALFGLGIFHGFQNGSCSTTGYSANYGPVQQCGKGAGWWMLMLTAGLFLAGGGAVLSGTAKTMAIPVLFVAIGVPFVALALRSGNTQLLIGRSSNTGKLYAGIFGVCFVIAGGAWGAINRQRTVSRFSGASRFGGILACVVGVGLGFAIAAGVASAIGPAAPTRFQPTSRAVNQSSRSTRQASSAITQATAQADKAAKLAACVTAAGVNNAKIQACVAKYTP